MKLSEREIEWIDVTRKTERGIREMNLSIDGCSFGRFSVNLRTKIINNARTYSYFR